jgi:hypothetical protein
MVEGSRSSPLRPTGDGLMAPGMEGGGGVLTDSTTPPGRWDGPGSSSLLPAAGLHGPAALLQDLAAPGPIRTGRAFRVGLVGEGQPPGPGTDEQRDHHQTPREFSEHGHTSHLRWDPAGSTRCSGSDPAPLPKQFWCRPAQPESGPCQHGFSARFSSRAVSVLLISCTVFARGMCGSGKRSFRLPAVPALVSRTAWVGYRQKWASPRIPGLLSKPALPLLSNRAETVRGSSAGSDALAHTP